MTTTKYRCSMCDAVVNNPDLGTQPVIPKGWKYINLKKGSTLVCDKC